MKDFEHNALSDLIYLFIDGEADDTQKSTLFAALANDTSLQAEFQSAMTFNALYPRPTSEDTMPPGILSRRLFEKAGFNPALAAPLATAVVAEAGRSGFLSSLSTKILAFKNILIPIATAAMGVIATAGLMINNSAEIQQGAVPKPTENSAIQTEIFKNNVGTGDYQIQKLNELHSQKSSTIPVLKKENKVLKTDALQAQIFKTESAPLKDIPNDKSLQKTADVTFLKISENVVSNLKTENNSGIILQPVLVIDTVRTEAAEGMTNYAVYTRKSGTVALLPARESSFGGHKFLDNTSLGAMYKMDENHGIVLEVGEETFPAYVKNAAGEFEFKNTLQWVTAGCRFTMLPVLDEIRPYGQIAGGYVLSGSGPVAKGLAGIQWQPFKNVSFSGGLEVTALFYKRENAQKVGGKVGYYYGLSILF